MKSTKVKSITSKCQMLSTNSHVDNEEEEDLVEKEVGDVHNRITHVTYTKDETTNEEGGA
jgi:hypothetical protein